MGCLGFVFLAEEVDTENLPPTFRGRTKNSENQNRFSFTFSVLEIWLVEYMPFFYQDGVLWGHKSGTAGV